MAGNFSAIALNGIIIINMPPVSIELNTDGRSIVLASSSFYRKRLLEQLRLGFETEAPKIDETVQHGENSLQLCTRLAQQKARALCLKYTNHIIIGSDQVAELDKKPLGKPGNSATNIEYLLRASGKTMTFYTSVCVLDSKTNRIEQEVDRCMVDFRSLDKHEIIRYVDKEKPFDCAGGFKFEGLGVALFEKFSGEDPNALVGLPLIRLCGLLERFGVVVI